MFLYGNEWKRVQVHIKTRSSTQARSHAQKFFIRLRKKFLDDGDDISSSENKIAIRNEKIFCWIKENVKKIVGEWHLNDSVTREKFVLFRDTYLRLFPKTYVFSVDGIDIKWDLWNDHFLNYYTEVIIYIDNRD